MANSHRALSGFSIWLGVSAFFFGLINAVIGLSRKLPRELFYRLTVINALAYAVLTVFAFVCWIEAPRPKDRHSRILPALGKATQILYVRWLADDSSRDGRSALVRLDEKVQLSRAQVDSVKKLYFHNNRPIQPIYAYRADATSGHPGCSAGNLLPTGFA